MERNENSESVKAAAVVGPLNLLILYFSAKCRRLPEASSAFLPHSTLFQSSSAQPPFHCYNDPSVHLSPSPVPEVHGKNLLGSVPLSPGAQWAFGIWWLVLLLLLVIVTLMRAIISV